MFTPTGMSASLTLKLIEKTKTQQLEALEKQAIHKRAIDKFLEKAPDVESIDEFVEDYDVFSFVMKAFDLEDKIYAKGMMKKIFESDKNDKTSLVNRLTDPRIKEIYEEMNFVGGGVTNLSTYKADWRQKIVDKYINNQFVDGQREANETVGIVLKAREKLPNVKTWFGVLADPDLGKFMRGALNMSDQNIMLDVDKQKEKFEKKYDLEKLKEPGEIEKLVDKFVAIEGIKEAQANMFNNPILQLMNPSYGWGGGGSFVPITMDMAAIGRFSGSAYR